MYVAVVVIVCLEVSYFPGYYRHVFVWYALAANAYCRAATWGCGNDEGFHRATFAKSATGGGSSLKVAKPTPLSTGLKPPPLAGQFGLAARIVAGCKG